ncbi:MAG: hypothetical protein Q8S94_09005 [Pseudohongiella sp.]|nr:hypothetical protein [Pseudohongiella sp.]
MTSEHNKLELQTSKSFDSNKLSFFAKSGLEVNVYDSHWRVLPNNGKGHTLNVSWIHSAEMSEADRWLILNAIIFYAKTKSANTAATVLTCIKPHLKNGIPTLFEINRIWSGLKTNRKKGLNQFFGTLARQGHQQFQKHHLFTSANLDKYQSNMLDSQKGSFSEIEFDSLAKRINFKLGEFDWNSREPLSFFQSPNGFGELRNAITNKILLSTVRRPIQLSIMKWCDMIPVGTSFKNNGVFSTEELGTLGSISLQLRVFVAKEKGSLGLRQYPERYPIHLSEDLSLKILQYKKVCMHGLKMMLESSGIKISASRLIQAMEYMPVLLSHKFFEEGINSIELIDHLFTPSSNSYHISEATITHAFRALKISSDRVAKCIASSNRVRHTVLTRGAQDGLPAMQLAKLTGVTVPAARHYVDLDYRSRRQIDSSYIGTQFLMQIFQTPISDVKEGDDYIADNQFNPVGGVIDKNSCVTCSTNMGKPLGCYGCPNFRPILEADHRGVLIAAEEKQAVNRAALLSPLHARSIEKLQTQIEWIKYTIAFCDEVISRQRALHA